MATEQQENKTCTDMSVCRSSRGDHSLTKCTSKPQPDDHDAMPTLAADRASRTGSTTRTALTRPTAAAAVRP